MKAFHSTGAAAALLVVSSVAESADQPPVEAPPVVVSATRTPQPLDRVGSSVTVIAGEELERRQTTIVSEALREVPGFAVNRAGGLGQITRLRIRGSEGNQTLVLIDGIEANDPGADSEFDFAHLLAQDIARIEALRGPQSVLYGSDAAGGVVNVITRRSEGPVSFGGLVEGGSFGTGRVAGSVGGGGERYDLFLSGGTLSTDGVSAASEERGNSEADGYWNGTSFGKLGLRPHDLLELDFVGRATRFSAEGDGFVGGVGAVDADQETDGDLRYGRAQAKLKLFDGAWEQTLGFSGSRQDRHLQDNGVETSRFEGTKRKLDYQSDVYVATPSLAEAEHVFTVLLEDEREDVLAQSAFTDVDRKIESRAAAGQYQLALLDRVFLTGGARSDDNEQFEDSTSWRATVAYLHKETSTKLKASYGTGVKNPTAFELYGFTANFRGNPNLEPEEANGWDAGIEQALFGDRLNLEAVYFNQRIDKLIAGAGQTAVNLDGESHSRGVELAATASLLPGLDLRAAFTIMRTSDPDGGELVRRPGRTGSLNIGYRFLEKRALLDLGVIHNGSQRDFAFDATFNRFAVTLESYTLVNLAGSYRLTEKLELFGRVENLLDEEYEEVFTYGAPGIAAYAGMRVSF